MASYLYCYLKLSLFFTYKGDIARKSDTLREHQRKKQRTDNNNKEKKNKSYNFIRKGVVLADKL